MDSCRGIKTVIKRKPCMCIRAGYKDSKRHTFHSVSTLCLTPFFPPSSRFEPIFSCPSGDFFIDPSILYHSHSMPDNSSYFSKSADQTVFSAYIRPQHIQYTFQRSAQLNRILAAHLYFFCKSNSCFGIYSFTASQNSSDIVLDLYIF